MSTKNNSIILNDALSPMHMKIIPYSDKGGVRCNRFPIFQIKRVLFYNSTIFKIKELSVLCYFIQNPNWDRKSQLSGLRTEPLNPREDKNKYSRYF